MNESKEMLFDFRTALTDLNLLHGININEDDFYEIGMLAWKKIGNRRVKFYMLENAEVIDKRVELPCNVYNVEAVTLAKEYCEINDNRMLPISALSIPLVLNSIELPDHDLFIPGSFVNYNLVKENGADYVEVNFNDGTKVHVVFTGLYVDDEGFPYLTQKESEAIAWYILYIYLHRNKLAKQAVDPNDMMLAKREWTRACGDARVPELLNQNLIDSVLNVMNSHNRKMFNKPFKIAM